MPKSHPKVPLAVKKGRIWFKIHSNSLTIALSLLFLISFIVHFVGSLNYHIEQNLIKGESVENAGKYYNKSSILD
jgi:hypothetical protein